MWFFDLLKEDWFHILIASRKSFWKCRTHINTSEKNYYGSYTNKIAWCHPTSMNCDVISLHWTSVELAVSKDSLINGKIKHVLYIVTNITVRSSIHEAINILFIGYLKRQEPVKLSLYSISSNGIYHMWTWTSEKMSKHRSPPALDILENLLNNGPYEARYYSFSWRLEQGLNNSRSALFNTFLYEIFAISSTSSSKQNYQKY